jgi:hypothetical protein
VTNPGIGYTDGVTKGRSGLRVAGAISVIEQVRAPASFYYLLEVMEESMSTGWRLFFGFVIVIVGVIWIVKGHVPIGIEGRPAAFHARGRWAVGLGVLAIILGLVIAFDAPGQLKVDSCLDRGGSFDYDENRCDSPRVEPAGQQ